MARPREHVECVVGPCVERATARSPFCRLHWGAIPDDLQERVKWALAYGSMEDLDAAIRAACDELRW